MKYTHILWDWNGTLLNDVQCSVSCVNDILSTRGISPTTYKLYVEMMEMPLDKYYSKLMDLSKLDYKQLFVEFQRGYEKYFDSISLQHGAVDVLDALKSAGARQFVVSSFEQQRLNMHVRHFKVDKYFEQISGSHDILVGSKVKRAQKIIGGTDIGNVVFIGDTNADYDTARQIGCDCILVSNGHQHKMWFDKLDCTVVNDITEIPALCGLKVR